MFFIKFEFSTASKLYKREIRDKTQNHQLPATTKNQNRFDRRHVTRQRHQTRDVITLR